MFKLDQYGLTIENERVIIQPVNHAYIGKDDSLEHVSWFITCRNGEEKLKVYLKFDFIHSQRFEIHPYSNETASMLLHLPMWVKVSDSILSLLKSIPERHIFQSDEPMCMILPPNADIIDIKKIKSDAAEGEKQRMIDYLTGKTCSECTAQDDA